MGYRSVAPRYTFQPNCDNARIYDGMTPFKIGEMVKRLSKPLNPGDPTPTITGTGNGPWYVDTHNHGVVIFGEWDPAKQELYVDFSGISRTFGLPTCNQVWNEVGRQIEIVQALPEPVAAPAPVVVASPPVVVAPPPVDVQPPPAPVPAVVSPPAAPVDYGSVAMQVDPAPAPVLSSRVDAMPGAPAASAAGALSAGGPNMMLVLGGGALVAGAFFWLRSREKSAG